MSISASGTSGSTITGIKTSFDGMSYTGTSFTTGYLTTAGSMIMTATATDSRGRSGTATRVISVTPYAPPSIAAFTAARCNSSGSAAQLDGTRGWITLAASVSGMSGRNTMSCTVYYKTSTSTGWTIAGSYSHSNYSINLTNSALSSSIYFNPLYSYDFRVVVSDYFGSVQMETGLGTKAVVFDI